MMLASKKSRESLDEIQRLLERLDAALIVRDPGTARSVEAFEGLRRTVSYAARARQQHVGQVVALCEALDNGASLETIADLAELWAMEAGLQRWSDPSVPDFFKVVEGGGDALASEDVTLAVIDPAWVDTATGEPVLVKPGTAKRVAGSEGQQLDRSTRPEEASEPEPTIAASQGAESIPDDIAPSNRERGDS